MKVDRTTKELTNNRDTIQLLSFTGGPKNLTFTLEKTKVYGWNLATAGEVYVLREEHHIEPVVITEAAAYAIMEDPMKGYNLLYFLKQLRHF